MSCATWCQNVRNTELEFSHHECKLKTIDCDVKTSEQGSNSYSYQNPATLE